jgi:hypothetical protein
MAPLSYATGSGAVLDTPNRIAFLFVPNGIDMANWTPTAPGKLALTPILESLKPVQNDVSVLTGLAQRNAEALGDGPGDHARSTAAWLTGVHPLKTSGADIRNGISADQVAAREIGTATRFASLEIGCERGGTSGDCDSGYSCAYSSNISWRSENTPMPKEVNPRLLFERLFGGGTAGEQTEAIARRNLLNKSILDFIMEDAKALQGKLGTRDQKKLDEYFTSVRDIERRLVQFEGKSGKGVVATTPAPKGIPQDFGEHIRLMGDMMVLAFQADLTRVCTFMFANDGSNRSYANIGVADGHHDVSHHGKQAEKLAKKKLIDTFHVEQLAYILGKMKSVREGDKSLLDSTTLIYGAGISDGDWHNHFNLPILVAGRGGGFKTGQHYVFPERTPLNNLFVTMLDRVGVKVDKLGDSTGRLQGLF